MGKALSESYPVPVTGLVSFQNNPKNLDPSYKMDLDLWDCLEMVKHVLQQNFMGLI